MQDVYPNIERKKIRTPGQPWGGLERLEVDVGEEARKREKYMNHLYDYTFTCECLSKLK